MKHFYRFLLLISIAFSSAAWAHTELNSSVPAQGAMLNASPKALELVFSAPVRLMKVSLQDKANNTITLASPSNNNSSAEYALSLPNLAPSHYTVHWIAMGEDGHRMQGTFDFMLHAHTHDAPLTDRDKPCFSMHLI